MVNRSRTSRRFFVAFVVAAVSAAGIVIPTAGAQSVGAFLAGAEPWVASDCDGEVPIVVASDATAQSDIYSAVTLAGVIGTDCIVLAGPRDGELHPSQRARLDAAGTGGYVLGGLAAVPDAKVAGRDMTRVAGPDRWATALAVGQQVRNATAEAPDPPPEASGELPSGVLLPGAFLDGAEPWVASDCEGDVPIVVGSDAAAQSDIYSAVTLAGVIGTDCIVLAGPRDGEMHPSQRARLDAAGSGGYVLGGVAAVPDAKIAGRDMTRVAGPDRWATAQLAGTAVAASNLWVSGVNAAGWGFHRTLQGNAVSSPLSIGAAFSLARAGASPRSASALDEIFGFPEIGVHDAAKSVTAGLAAASSETTTLEVANRIFPHVAFSLSPEFLDTAVASYDAGIQPVDTDNGDQAARIINAWVSESTRGLIPAIVDGAAVQDQSLIMANTVYLKADWASPFDPDSTRDHEFATDSGATVTTPFMWDRGLRRYVRLDGADAVELRYMGDDLAMWLVVPHDLDGLQAVEEMIGPDELVGWGRTADEGDVVVHMPKWEQTLPPRDLFRWLCPLGLCARAPFENIGPKVEITAALHSAKLIVDEKGTEAAAATAIGARATSVEPPRPPPDLVVVADRPFLFAIVHEQTGAILFVGRLTDPTE